MSYGLAFEELQQTVQSVWPYAADQLRDNQIRRIKWLEFIAKADAGDPVGLDTPFVIEEFGAWRPHNGLDGYGYAGDVQASACNIYFVDSNEIPKQTVTAVGSPGNTIGVASTARFFVDQRVFFQGSSVYAQVVSIDSAVQMTVDSNAGVMTGNVVRGYDLTELLEFEAKTLRAALDPVNEFDEFFTDELAVIDSSSYNPANVAIGKANYPFQAVQLSLIVYR